MSPKNLILSLAGAAFALSATPALAAKTASRDQPAKADSQVYCVKYELTVGSRIAKSECKTRKQWEREGVDIAQAAGRTTA